MMKTKTEKAYEKEIQNNICEYLQIKKIFFWRSNNVPIFGQSNDGKRRFRALPKFTPKGIPDIICVIAGRFYGFEVKRIGGKIRDEQVEFGMKVKLNGGVYAIVHSIQEVKDVLEETSDIDIDEESDNLDGEPISED